VTDEEVQMSSQRPITWREARELRHGDEVVFTRDFGVYPTDLGQNADIPDITACAVAHVSIPVWNTRKQEAARPTRHRWPCSGTIPIRGWCYALVKRKTRRPNWG
jgi:hypothetical protein